MKDNSTPAPRRYNNMSELPNDLHLSLMGIANSAAGMISRSALSNRDKIPAYYLRRFPDAFNAIAEGMEQACDLLDINYERVGSIFTMIGFTAFVRTVTEDRARRYGMDLQQVQVEINLDATPDEVGDLIDKISKKPHVPPAPEQGKN